MGTSAGYRTRPPARRAVAFALGVTLAVVAAACGGDDKGAAPTTTVARPGTTDAGSAPATTAAAATTTTVPKRGGTLTVRVEAEVGNPWTPANMQCDASCYMRARTFFDPLMVIDATDN